MKKLCYLVFMICAINTYAQVEETNKNAPIIIGDEPRERMATLTSGRGTHGVYFGLSSGYSQINEKDIVSMGFKFAYVADTKFEIGFGFEGIQSEKGISYDADIPLYLTAGMGGLHLEPILFGRKRVHMSFPIFIGGGVAYLYDQQDWDFDADPPFDLHDYEEWEPLLMIQPGANVVFNISRFLQLEAGVKYRITNDLSLNRNDIGDLNAVMGSIGLKVGFFDFGR